MGDEGMLADAAVASGVLAGRSAAALCVAGNMPANMSADRPTVGTARRRAAVRADVRGDDAGFAAERPRLVGLAYRMLGSLADAEDVVQEAWLRWDRTDRRRRSSAAWLTTVTSRLAIDRLRAQQRRGRTTSVRGCRSRSSDRGPVDHDSRRPCGGITSRRVAHDGVPGAVGATRRARAGRLPPRGCVRRAVRMIGEVVDRSPEACRQMASRARRRSQMADSTAPLRRGAAGRAGRCDRGRGHGGCGRPALARGRAPQRRGPRGALPASCVLGPERVARLLVNLARNAPEATSRSAVNAAPALVVRSPELTMAVTAERDGRTGAIEAVPDAEPGQGRGPRCPSRWSSASVELRVGPGRQVDRLELQVLLEALGAQLPTDPRLLVPAERRAHAMP